MVVMCEAGGGLFSYRMIDLCIVFYFIKCFFIYIMVFHLPGLAAYYSVFISIPTLKKTQRCSLQPTVSAAGSG